MEWVEVRGKTIDVAVQAAMQELGVDDRERVDVEVLQEPERGFLGLGGKDAVVKVKLRPARSGRRRRRRRGGGGRDRDRSQDNAQTQDGARQKGRPQDDRGQSRSGNGRRGDAGQSAARKGRQQGRGGDEQQQQRSQKQRSQKQGSSKQDAGGDGGRGRSGGQKAGVGQAESGTQAGDERRRQPAVEEARVVTIEEQMPVVEEFLSGLVGAFGLEGEVEVDHDQDVILADITGSQTEAMVGPRGSVIEAVHELTKTVLQRQTQSSARLRLDIAGYGRRRRQALSIYAHQLIDQALEEGGELMMEPMSAGDRKVIHDAVAEREGVRSYSEGEDPSRYVVIAATGETRPEVDGEEE